MKTPGEDGKGTKTWPRKKSRAPKERKDGGKGKKAKGGPMFEKKKL